ncbi:MAG TPA: hypothetical protein VF759_05255 [Allosphingosinicella sp.]
MERYTLQAVDDPENRAECGCGGGTGKLAFDQAQISSHLRFTANYYIFDLVDEHHQPSGIAVARLGNKDCPRYRFRRADGV